MTKKFHPRMREKQIKSRFEAGGIGCVEDSFSVPAEARCCGIGGRKVSLFGRLGSNRGYPEAAWILRSVTEVVPGRRWRPLPQKPELLAGTVIAISFRPPTGSPSRGRLRG